ncbi:MAG: putative transporter ATP-binding protein YxlF, partial [Planctomycetota bacterium]
NGSGKTTLLRTLAGLQRPTGGTVEILGQPSHAPDLRRRVAFQPEGQLPLTVLSAPEMLAYVGAQLGLANAESDRRAAQWLDRLDLRHAGNRRAGTFSTGMQKRLALAMALLAEPEVLLLDEPTSGLDPFGSEAVVAILRELAAGGTTIVLASHHLLEVEECCDELLVLQDGEVRAHGRRADLLATGETALLLRGLDEAGLERLSAHATALGAVDVHRQAARGSLFDLLRRVAKGHRDS